MRLRLLVAALALAALAVPAADAARGTPAGSGLTAVDGLIAYVYCCGLHATGIWVLDPRTGTTKHVFTPKYDDSPLTPAWSHDGRRLAYAPGPDTPGIWAMRPYGGGKHRVTPGVGDASWPTWSVAGTKIAFGDLARRGAKQHDIWVVRTNGAGLTRLTTSAADEGTPAWAPDDSAIAYARGHDVWLMRTNGSGQHRVLVNASSPSWSPGATHLAFVRDGDVWVAKRNGAAAKRVAHPADQAVAVTWSPDGRWLVAATADRGDLLLLRADGSSGQTITQDPGAFHNWPAWQPVRKK
jgi:Tol biopolymer transport system component